MPTRTVLIIDDNPVVCVFLQGYFKTHAFSVETADTGDRGCELAFELLPDLILVQGVLPDTTGMAVIHRLRARAITRETPVIFYTGSHKEKMRYRLNPPENTYYLYSPWDEPRLHCIIEDDVWFEARAPHGLGAGPGSRGGTAMKRKAL